MKFLAQNLQSLKSKFPVLVALGTQLLVFILQTAICKFFSYQPGHLVFLGIQILCSLLITQYVARLQSWFIYISIFFPILFFLSFNFIHYSNHIYGIFFLILLFTFSHTLKERVPLYLTNDSTIDALVKISREKKIINFVDLGSGSGKVVRALARNQISAVGVETAPVLWLWSYSLSMLMSLGEIRRKNIWETDLNEFNFVYVFLSPAVMTRIYTKALKEMKNSTYLVSNSFQIEGVEPDEIWELADNRETKLYLYQIN